MSKKSDRNYMKVSEEARLMAHFKDIWMSKARFDGMPEEIPRNYPLWGLWNFNCMTFFHLDEADMYLCLPVATESVMKDPYGLPSKWRAVAQGDLASVISAKVLTPENAVLIWADPAHVCPEPFVRNIVRQMVNVEYTKRLNVNAQKMPINVITSDARVLNDLNVAEQFLEAKPIMITDKNVADRLEIVNLGVQFIGPDLDDTYNRYYCRIMDYLGCDNVNVDKKERLITAEAEANNEQTILKHYAFMEEWRDAAERINKLFGLSVEVVDVNEEQQGMMEEDDMQQDEVIADDA